MRNAYRLVFSPKMTRERPTMNAHGPKDVAEIMAPFSTVEPVEVFWILLLDAQHKLIGGRPVELTRGILNASLIHPREVFRAAIVGGAAAIILCHNHPSGILTPSVEDREVTASLVAAGRLVDIPVHDHIIMGHSNNYFSFVENGLL